jgi:hypothetical protein
MGFHDSSSYCLMFDLNITPLNLYVCVCFFNKGLTSLGNLKRKSGFIQVLNIMEITWTHYELENVPINYPKTLWA